MVLRHRPVAVVVLLLLTVLPLSGTLCAALCAPAGAARAAGDHAVDSPCHGTTGGGAGVRASSGHECGRHGVLVRGTTAARIAARADLGAPAATHHAAPLAEDPSGRAASLVRSSLRAATGAASPPRAARVLRI